MPGRPLQPCGWPGGCTSVQVEPYCEKHGKERKRERSKSSHKREHQRLYNRQWREHIRIEQLAKEPWCARCGPPVLATDVHHVERHEGDTEKFYGSPLESLCHSCHSSETANEVGLHRRHPPA